MFGKGLIFVLIILFVGAGFASAFSISVSNYSKSTDFGNWLYVGGSGPGNYTSIQDAIDNATDGDIIYVYSGTYYEDIVIEKSISLEGQDKNTTIIQGAGDINDTVSIFSDNVKISDFTLKDNGPYGVISVILYAETNGSFITGNIFIGDVSYESLFSSIYIVRSNHNIISDNIFENGTIRIYYNSSYNEISSNVIESADDGIFFSFSSSNIIKNNEINGAALEGICIAYANDNIISYNSIKNCKCGICLISENCEITYNNFISNKINAKIYSSNNEWNHNYWGRPRFLPKPIIWFVYGVDPESGFWWKSIIDFDWHPAKKLNDV